MNPIIHIKCVNFCHQLVTEFSVSRPDTTVGAACREESSAVACTTIAANYHGTIASRMLRSQTTCMTL